MGSIAHRILEVLAPLALTAGAAAQGQLLVVDKTGGPGSQFTQIADAVAAASPGATILVRAGVYEEFVVDGKTLVITGAPGANVVVDDSEHEATGVTVRNVAPSELVVIEGLRVWGDDAHGIVVENCGGQVWLQDCEINIANFNASIAKLRVTNSSRVLVVRCDAAVPGFGDADGLHATQSRVFAWESKFEGGRSSQFLGQSGTGAVIEGGHLFAEGSEIRGGLGVSEATPTCFQVKSGDGLHLMDQAQAIVLDTVVEKGGMAFAMFPCGWSLGVPTVIQPGSTYEVLPGDSASFSVGSPVLDGVSTTLEIQGAPGDLPLVMIATAVAPVNSFAKYKGVLAMGNPFLIVLSPLPASGTMSLHFGFGDALSPGTGSTLFLQGALFKSGGGGLLADPMTLTTWEE